MSEVVQLLTNVPLQVALRYSEPKPVDGGFGPRLMLSLLDGRILYTPTIVGDKLKASGIGRAEPFTICKRETNGKVKWEVSKVQPASAPPPSSAPAVAIDSPNGSGHPSTTAKPAPACLMTGQSQFCLQQLIAAIEAVHAAEKYSKAMGREVQFTSEDIRAFAISCFISQSREAR